MLQSPEFLSIVYSVSVSHANFIHSFLGVYFEFSALRSISFIFNLNILKFEYINVIFDGSHALRRIPEQETRITFQKEFSRYTWMSPNHFEAKCAFCSKYVILN